MCCHMIKAADLHDNPINPSYRPSVGEMHRVLQHNSTDQPEVHEIAREMRRLTNEYSERLLIARSTCRSSG
jgi:alpha-glucosidase